MRNANHFIIAENRLGWKDLSITSKEIKELRNDHYVHLEAAASMNQEMN